jgi:hypothetical protein
VSNHRQKTSIRLFLAGLFALAALVTTPHVADARGGPGDKTLGLGLQLGVPLGITGKVFFHEIPALQFGFGGVFPYGGVGGWADVVFHFVKIRNGREDVLTLHLYAGPGVQLGFAGPYYTSVVRAGPRGPAGDRVVYNYAGGPFSLGIRAPLGFAIHWQKVTFDTYVEVSPVVYVLPGVYVVGEGAIGARYYF